MYQHCTKNPKEYEEINKNISNSTGVEKNISNTDLLRYQGVLNDATLQVLYTIGTIVNSYNCYK